MTPAADKRRPRIGVTISQELLDLIQGFAERKQWSVSKAAEYLLEAGVNAQLSEEGKRHLSPEAMRGKPSPDGQDLVKLMELLKNAKDLGLL